MSPRAETLARAARAGTGPAGLLDTLRALAPAPRDAALAAAIGTAFARDPAAAWLAETIRRHGPEPLWPAAALAERRRRLAGGGLEPAGGIRAQLGTSAGGRPVEAWFFPGTADARAGRALVLGGVHGDEASAAEVVARLLARLAAGERPEADALVVPVLFPDLYAARLREGDIPTNRNFPLRGESLRAARRRGGGRPVDDLGRPLLPENVLLLDLIRRFRPDRIASLHATPKPERAGIFADPHAPASAGTGAGTGAAAAAAAAAALTAADAALALRLAGAAAAAGARVAGNGLGGRPTAIWGGEVSGGMSLGGWGPAPVAEGGPDDRASIPIVTVEVAGLEESAAAADPAARAAELDAFADALLRLFLRGA